MEKLMVDLYDKLKNYFENKLGRQLSEKEKELIKVMANKEVVNP